MLGLLRWRHRNGCQEPNFQHAFLSGVYGGPATAHRQCPILTLTTVGELADAKYDIGSYRRHFAYRHLLKVEAKFEGILVCLFDRGLDAGSIDQLRTLGVECCNSRSIL